MNVCKSPSTMFDKRKYRTFFSSTSAQARPGGNPAANCLTPTFLPIRTHLYQPSRTARSKGGGDRQEKKLTFYLVLVSHAAKMSQYRPP